MSNRIQLQNADLSPLKGKSALILGGGSGSGLATALALAKAGVRVTVADIVPHSSIISQFQSHGLGIQYVKCDVTYWQQQAMAFKQAIQFAPSQSLDLVCCFAAVDRRQDLVEEAKQVEPRIDIEPMAPILEEVEVNLKGVFDSTKLALHYFRIPDRATVLRRARPGTPSSASSITRSSVRSRSRSRSGSRPRSTSGSRSRSPIPAPPTPPLPPTATVDEAVPDAPELTEPEEKVIDADSKDTEKEEVEVKFTKSLIIVSGLSGYADDCHSSFYSASSFALRGLFRSIRTKAERELGIRVNLVAPWALRTPATEPLLEKLAEAGIIEREDDEDTDAPVGAGDASHDNETTPAKTEAEEVNAISLSAQEEVKDVSEPPAPSVSTQAVNDDGGSPSQSDSQTQPQPESGLEVVNDSTPLDTPVGQATESGHADREVATEVSTEANGETHVTANEEVDGATDAEAHGAINEETHRAATGEANGTAEEETNGIAINGTAQPAKTSGSPTTDAGEPPNTENKTSTNAEATAVAGVKKQVRYKNMHFASVQDVADTVAYLCSDSSKSGRAIAVMPEGAFDLHDDHEGGYAGEQVQLLLNMRRDAGDMICKVLNLVPDQQTEVEAAETKVKAKTDANGKAKTERDGVLD